MADIVEEEVILGFGKTIEFSDTENGSYTKLPGSITTTLPDRELGEAETTNDDSPDFHRQFIPGLYDPGVVSLTYRYSATGYAMMEELFQLAADAVTRPDAIKWWKVTLIDGAVAKFRGWVKKNGMPVELDTSPEVECEIRATGKMSFTPAGGS